MQENGRSVLYLQVKMVIYGMIDSALLWYELYVRVLKELDFELNPYDMYVANRTINGKQYTITWYVYDDKISYVEQSVIDDIINKIEE